MKVLEIESKIKELFGEWVEGKSKEQSSSKIRYSGPDLGREEYMSMLDAIFNNWWSGGKYTIKAENKLAEISNGKYGLLTNSGSSANLVMISAAKDLWWEDGDLIVTLSCGFPTTVNPIIQNRLVPLFVDISMDDLSLDPELLDKVLSEYAGRAKGVFIAHTLGFKGDVDGLLEVCDKHGVKLLFDCCDAYGTKHRGKPIQSYGEAATFSFYAAHHLTMGEGGGIVTNDDELFAAMRGIRSWGRYCASKNCCIRSVNPSAFCPIKKLTDDSSLPEDYIVNYQYEWLGYNLKPLDLQSAMLIEQMNKLEDFNERRRQNYALLYDCFSNSAVDYKLWSIDSDISPFAFPVVVPDEAPFQRKDLVNHLKKNHIESRLLFGGNLTRHPAYAKNKKYWEFYGDRHENADTITEKFVMLGCSHVNSVEQTKKIVEAVDEFHRDWEIK